MSEEEIYHPSHKSGREFLGSRECTLPLADDPELERDYLFLAQWLLDIHREFRRKRDHPQDGQIDKGRPTRTI